MRLSKNTQIEEHNPLLSIPTQEEFLSITDSTGKTQIAASEFEITIAKALKDLHIEFVYQYPFKGFFVDFMITKPIYMPLEANGVHWHTDRLGARDFIKQAILRNYFGILYIIWDKDAPDYKSTKRILASYFT